MRKMWMLLFAAVLLAAADAPWMSKPISQWSAEDAKQVLARSAWAKMVTPSLLPALSEAQLREGGKMGGGKGVGLEGFDQSALTGIGGGDKRSAKDVAAESMKRGKLTVRWESALPIRSAELRAAETDAPDWDGDYYAIAVYDVPSEAMSNLEHKDLPGELRRLGFLKREGKKDLRPSRVDVVPEGSKLARIVYLFPRSAGITKEDQRVAFEAQIGRLWVAQYFELQEMQFQGKLEL